MPLNPSVIDATVYGLVDLHPPDARISTQGMTTRAEEGANSDGSVIPRVEKMSQPAT